MSAETRTGDRGLRTPEELVAIGFGRSHVVMMNEAHSAWQRCIRTREVGRRVLPVAYAAGARFLAMEALWPTVAAEANRARHVPESDHLGYIGQPEMRQIVQDGLDLGFTLLAYEASREDEFVRPGEDPMGMAATNRREAIQARNLVQALAALPPDAKLLVWCGNGHLVKAPLRQWSPMGYQFQVQSGVAPFTISQTRTVAFPGMPDAACASVERLAEEYGPQLLIRGGTAGWLTEEAPPHLRRSLEDAFLLSVHNHLE
jgi:hypothetical protein